MSSQGSWVFNERGNPQTTGLAAAAPKTNNTQAQVIVAPYTLQQHKSKLKVKTKQEIQRPEIPHPDVDTLILLQNFEGCIN